MPKIGAFAALALTLLALAVVSVGLGPGEVSFAQTAGTSTPTATPTSIVGQGTEAVAYQVNAAHTGAAQLSSLVPPLAQKWTFSPGGAISYPVIAQGHVFVTVADPNYGTRLYALDENTGAVAWGPVELGGTYWWSASAFDAGRLYVITYSGVLRAFDAQAGSQLWSTQLPGESSFTSPPTALQGIVFVGGSGSAGLLYAVDENTGTLLWAQPVTNGDESSPALSDDGVSVAYPCPNVYKFGRSTGSLLWQYPATQTCSAGGGRTAVYYQGRLYARNPGANVSGLILDSQSGALVGSFAAGPAPALAGSTRYTLSAGVLSAVDLTSGTILWTFSGDGTLSSAPIVVNTQVYVGGTSGTLYALDAGTGRQLWTTGVGAGIPAPDEQNVTQPLTGLNAGEGMLVVPAGNLLVAYTAAPPPPTPTPTPSPTSSPTATATSTPSPTPSPTSTPTSTATPSPSPSPTSTATATPTPSKKGHGH